MNCSSLMLLGLQIRHYPKATPERYLLNLNLLSVTTLSFGDNIYVRRVISIFLILFSLIDTISYVNIQISFLLIKDIRTYVYSSIVSVRRYFNYPFSIADNRTLRRYQSLFPNLLLSSFYFWIQIVLGDNMYVRRIISNFLNIFSLVGKITHVDIQISFEYQLSSEVICTYVELYVTF